jgi:hypothetical protein
MWMIFAGAARQGPRPAAGQRRMGPYGLLVTLLVVAAIPVAYPAFRVVYAIIGGIIVLSVLVALCYGVAHRNDKPADPLDNIVASWKD